MNNPEPDLLAEVDALLDLVADYRDAFQPPKLVEIQLDNLRDTAQAVREIRND